MKGGIIMTTNIYEFKNNFRKEHPEILAECKKLYLGEYAYELFEELLDFFYEAEKRGMKTEFRFGRVYIKSSNFGEWYFEPCFGQITLMHKNRMPVRVGEYHTQFVKKISFRDIAVYIDEHDRARYTNEFVHFSMV